MSSYLFLIQSAHYNPINYSINCQTIEAVETAHPAILVEQDLDTFTANGYNIHCAEVAQLVEQRTENANPIELIERFIASRRDGLSPLTIHRTYRLYLRRSSEVIGLNVTGYDIQRFLATRTCTNGGKHAYFRTLKCFYNWLYSPKSGWGRMSKVDTKAFMLPVTRHSISGHTLTVTNSPA